ncbi:MAG TPA: glycerate kinase [Gemmatimonadales bacterium]|jgi:glycerate kinase|nr:glycerate kinase [Gemmatimonadales bacterium]
MPVILVAPAAFKGTFGPRQIADSLAVGIRKALPDAKVLTCPVADGGDGLLEAVLPPGSLLEKVSVTGPLGAPVSAELGWLDADTAIFASSSACGLALVPPDQRAPLRATTRGVGELIWEAADRGARTVVVGLGGSATVDGGTGAGRGLGWSFTDSSGVELPEGGGALGDLAAISGGWRLGAQVVALTDVTNPLTGPNGAAAVFGPQKGASRSEVEQLAAGLGRLAECLDSSGHPGMDTLPGGGAAGGLGAGLAAFARASLTPGAPWVLDRIGFDAALATVDLVITGEGEFDATSFAGKVTGEIVRRAQAARRRIAVVAGRAAAQVGITVVSGEGGTLSQTDIEGMGHRVAREALGLPAS